MMKSKVIDLFMFMGQSNMAGRGIVNEEHPVPAPKLLKGAGYEYRAVSAADKLVEIEEPFGRYEDRVNGIDDGMRKTGSMVTAFANAYYENTGVPIVGVSASKGGSKIEEWQPESVYLKDAITRLHAAVSYLEQSGYEIRHKYMLWCQGESDGDIGKSGEAYREDFERMLNKMLQNGIEKCFMVRIGNYNGTGMQDYHEIMQAQKEIAKTNEHVIMVSTAFVEMKKRGLMKDDFHYYQEAYNEVGTEAGIHTAFYVETGKEPAIYDYELKTLYVSRKN